MLARRLQGVPPPIASVIYERTTLVDEYRHLIRLGLIGKHLRDVDAM